MSVKVEIARATEADAAAIAAIYAHHVLHGTATFEIVPPDSREFAARMAKVHAADLPWLVARIPRQAPDGRTGEVLGFAYAGAYHTRPAYRFTCESSIYVDRGRLGEGIGSALLAALLDASAAAGMRQMIALIAGSEPASIALHERFGFTRCGLLKNVGRKRGQWLDVIHMQRELGPGAATPQREEPG